MNSNAFKPFQVFMKLETPVAIGRMGLSLDGLLLFCLRADIGDPNANASCLDSLLKKHDSGAYHASQAIFTSQQYKQGDAVLERLIARTMPTIAIMRSGTDLNDRMIRPNGANGKYKQIITGGGSIKLGCARSRRIGLHMFCFTVWAILKKFAHCYHFTLIKLVKIGQAMYQRFMSLNLRMMKASFEMDN